MIMTRGRAVASILVLVLGVGACSDNGTSPEEDPLAAFVGNWSATSFVYTSDDDPSISVPVLEAVPGSSVSVAVEADGSFLSQINLGELTGGETQSIPGTIEHEGANRITVTFATNPFFTEPLDVTYQFQTENTLSWQAPTTFDFNEDGTPTAATLDVVFQRN